METQIKHRSLVFVFLMSIFTLGIYYFYWTYKTKEEINALGGKIPTAFLIIIPFANLYFHYCYADNFVKYVQKDPQNDLQIILLTLVLICCPFIGPVVVQSALNKLATCGNCDK